MSTPSFSSKSSSSSSPTTEPFSDRRSRRSRSRSSSPSLTIVLQDHQEMDDRRRSNEGGSTWHRRLEVLSTRIESMSASMLLNTFTTVTLASELGSLGCLFREPSRLIFFIICSFFMIAFFICSTIFLSVNAFSLIHERSRTEWTIYINGCSVLIGAILLFLFLYPMIRITQSGMHCTPLFWMMYFSFAILLIFCTAVFVISFFSHRNMTRTRMEAATILLMGVHTLSEEMISDPEEISASEDENFSTQENTEKQDQPGACGFDSTWKPKSKDDD